CHRAAPAQLVAPVVTAVAGEALVLEAAHRVEPAEADALRAVEHVFALLRGGQGVETEVLAAQLERLQVAQGEGVFVVAGVRLARLRVVLALGAERAEALLPAGVEVDEGAADAPAVVE